MHPLAEGMGDQSSWASWLGLSVKVRSVDRFMCGLGQSLFSGYGAAFAGDSESLGRPRRFHSTIIHATLGLSGSQHAVIGSPAFVRYVWSKQLFSCRTRRSQDQLRSKRSHSFMSGSFTSHLLLKSCLSKLVHTLWFEISYLTDLESE